MERLTGWRHCATGWKRDFCKSPAPASTGRTHKEWVLPPTVILSERSYLPRRGSVKIAQGKRSAALGEMAVPILRPGGARRSYWFIRSRVPQVRGPHRSEERRVGTA